MISSENKLGRAKSASSRKNILGNITLSHVLLPVSVAAIAVVVAIYCGQLQLPTGLERIKFYLDFIDIEEVQTALIKEKLANEDESVSAQVQGSNRELDADATVLVDTQQGEAAGIPENSDQAENNEANEESHAEVHTMHQEEFQDESQEADHEESRTESHDANKVEESYAGANSEANQEESHADTPEANHEESHADTPEANHEESHAGIPEANHEESHADIPEANHEESHADTPEANHEESHADTPEANHEESHADTPEANHEESHAGIPEANHEESHADIPEANHEESHADIPETDHEESHADIPEAKHEDLYGSNPEAGHDSSQTEIHKEKQAHPLIKFQFINKHNEAVKLYWLDYNEEEKPISTVAAGEQSNFSSYETHVWVLRLASNSEFIRSIVITPETKMVVSLYEKELEFKANYKEENGFPWLNVYPRDPFTKHIPDPVEIGHVVEVELPNYFGSDPSEPTMRRQMKTIGTDPKIFLIENFVSEEEADLLKDQAQKKDDFERSEVSDTVPISAVRTSSQTWLSSDHSDLVELVFKRSFELLKLPFSHETYHKDCESMQVLFYREGQEYQEHYDYFVPPDYPAFKDVQLGRNRYATVFLYLNDVEEGGETMFPRFGNKYVKNACEVDDGFRVKPKKGSASIFFSMLPDGNLDFNSLHGGCPVKQGEKWGANLWFWEPIRDQ